MKKELSFGITITGYKEEHYAVVAVSFNSRYASTSQGCSNVQELIDVIENICGKGSFCLYKGKGERCPESISYMDHKDYWQSPITYWQQNIKTQVIEEAREIAIQIWGNIPELEIGWMENQCKSYIEDLNLEERV